MNNMPDSILEIANTCQNYNIGKIFISDITTIKVNQSSCITNQ